MLMALPVVLRIRGPAGIAGRGREPGPGLAGVLRKFMDEMAGEFEANGVVDVDCSSPSVIGSISVR